MTTTRYNSTMAFTNGIMVISAEDWLRFCNDIKKGCTFTLFGSTFDPPTYKMCHFESRYYYDKFGVKHFHVSNDDRRKIVAYLNKNYL